MAGFTLFVFSNQLLIETGRYLSAYSMTIITNKKSREILQSGLNW